MQTIGPKANSSVQGSDLLLFEQFLKDPATSIPIDSNFLVAFNSGIMPRGIRTFATTFAAGLNSYEPSYWGIEVDSSNYLDKLSGKYNYNCYFAQGVTLPSESVGNKRVGMQDLYGDQSGGILSGVVSTSRDQRGPLSMSLLETNISFIDTIIRPWVMAVSHYGLYARNDNSIYNVKTNISVVQFDHKSEKLEKIRKRYTFFGCAPIGFEESTIAYGKADTTVTRVNWVYNYYTLDTSGNINYT